LEDRIAPAVVTPFTVQFSANTTGDIAIIGNTLETASTVNNSGMNQQAVTNAQNAVGGSSNGNNDNNAWNMAYVNVNNPATFNSSQATLTLPAGATVLFAGLYWGSVTTTAAQAAARNTVLFYTPSSSGGVSVTATTISANTISGADFTGLPVGNVYHAFANVTALVQAAGAGTYMVGNVQAALRDANGNLPYMGSYAGWSLVVAFSAPSQPERNLTVFNGFAVQQSNDPALNIPISGFVAPPSGTVNAKVGVVAYEGDLAITGDSMALNGTQLNDAVNPANNFFDSQISNLGVPITAKNPNYVNQMGFDAKVVQAPNNLIPNGATSATITLSTSGDGYFPGVVTTAIDLYSPNLVATKSVTDITAGGKRSSVAPGDVLQYTINVTNSGMDAARNVVLTDPIPTNTQYVAGTLQIVSGANAGAKTDAPGDDQAEFNSAGNDVVFRLGTGANATTGGTLAISGANASTTISFEVQVNAGSPANTVINNQATTAFNGVTTGLAFTSTSNVATVTVLGLGTSPNPTTVTLGANPVTLTDTAILAGCSSPTGTITFTLFYNGGPTPIDTEHVNVNGNGSYTTPTGFTLRGGGTVTGTYQWNATYSGDSNNSSVSDNNAVNEQVTVQPGSTSTATAILDAATNHPPSATVAESVYDTATVTGGSAAITPTGTVTYTFTGSQLAGLTAPPGWTVVNATTWTDTVTLNGGLVPNSPATPALPAGSYQFQASYTGDGNYTGSTSPVEPLNIGAGKSNTATLILHAGTNQPPSGVLGESVFDTATVNGSAFTPTGTVTYTFTGPQLATLTAPPGWTVLNSTTWTDTVTLSGGLAPNSPATPALPAGGYQFTARYGGDTNYTGSTSAVEPLTISQASTSTQTEILDAITNLEPSGVLGETVYDTATVTASPFTPTGTVTYILAGSPLAHLSAPAGWTVVNPTTWSNTVTLNGGLVPNSPTTPVLPAGGYLFQASYSGNGNYTGSTSSPEPLTINQGSTSTATAILDAATNQPPSGTVGESVYDTATVTGTPFTPTGSVTYTFTGPQLATLTAPAGWTVVNATTWTDTVTLSGGLVPNSPATGALPTGSYQFLASYTSGDSNYTGSISPVEPLNIGPKSSETQTQILDTRTNQTPSGVLGESVYDTATVAGSPFTPTGTVNYTLTGSELAHLTAPPGWTVFNSTTWTDTVTISFGRVPNSPATPALLAGSYQFQASYNGDSNYTGSTSAVEPLTISQGSSSTGTEILDAKTNQSPSGVLGESVYDTATVTGSPAAFTPTGTVTYTLTGPQLASLTAPPGWTVVNSTTWTDTVTLSAGLAPNSPATPALPAGSYQFHASYSGDTNYASSASPFEPLSVDPGNSRTATAILDASTNQPPGGTVGESVYDTATVTGSPAAFTPTGTVTYILTGSQLANLTAPPGWTVIGATTWTDTVTLNGGVVPNSLATPALPAGDYQFRARYKSGDNNYTGSISPVEPLNVGAGSSDTETTILDGSTNQAPSGVLGESVYDTATVTGGPFTPTGSVTYTLTGAQLASLAPPAGWTVVNSTTWTDMVTLSGGLAPNSAATPSLPAGGYEFQASYSGDNNHTGSTSALEPLTINQGSSDAATKILDAATNQAPSGALGESVYDTATVTGSPSAFTPTGTVTYNLTGPQLASLTAPAGWTVVLPADWTETVTLSGGVVPNSRATPPLPAGSYQFQASYSGDNNYASAVSAVEPLTISQGKSTTATNILDAGNNQPPSGVLGESVYDTATVTGSPYTPTGTVTYTLTGPQLASLTAPAGWTVVDPTIWTNTAPISGGLVPNSPATPGLPAGSYQFTASYSGDSNYTGSMSPIEPLIISQGSSSAATTILDAATNAAPGGTLGESVYDTAAVTGNPFTPTGTVTYTFTGNQLATLTAPPGWTVLNPTTWTDTVTLSGGLVPNSFATPALPAGSYQFTGSYSGDTNYTGFLSPVEPLTISPGSSETATKILDAATDQLPTGNLGESVYDTATVTGTPFTPTGTVTYTFAGPQLATLTVPAGWDQAGQTGLTTWTDTVTLSGGLVPNSLATPALPAGSYQFQAGYSGDGNYNGSASPVEPLNLGTGISNTDTKILDTVTNQPPSGLLGESVFDTATVTGSAPAITPTGTVTYTLTGAQLAHLTPPAGWTVFNPTTWTDTVTLSGGLVPDSLDTPALPAGSYQFQAAYSGDTNHTGSTSPFEPLTISPGSTSTQTEILDAATNQLATGSLGESVYDTATVTGSPAAFTPTGTVTYRLTGAQLATLTAPPGWTVVNSTTWTDTVTLSSGLVPNSLATPALLAGSYRFQASYHSGDTNYALSTSPVEPLQVNPGSTSTATLILNATTNQPPSGTVGESVYDTATVTGSPAAFTPTGTVTYRLTGAQLATLTAPPGWTVVSSTTWTDTVTLSGGNVPRSAATPALPAGNYFFRAMYISGDRNYTGSISPVEPLNVGPGSSDTETIILDAATNQPPSGVLGESVYDTAAVTATPFTPTGTVTYTLTGSQLANLTAPAGWTVVNPTTWTETVTLSAGVVPPSAATPLLAAGTYEFQAGYSGDRNYTGSTSALEPLTINQSSSDPATIILDAATNQPPSGVLGESVYDTATVTASPFTPTGTVTYTLTGPQLTSLSASPGWTVVNSTTWTNTVPLSGGLVPSSPATPALPAGSYQFLASYSGDTNYAGSISPVEPLAVSSGSSDTVTLILDATTNLPPTGVTGESVYDTATVTGSPAAFAPTGTVTYILTGSQLANLIAPPGWAVIGATTWTDTVTLSGGVVPNSLATPALLAGDYTFQAIYESGDGNYADSTSPVEPLNVGPGSSNTETVILDAATNQAPTGGPGVSVYDTATVTGSPFVPTGTLTYEFFTNGNASGPPASMQTVKLNPDGTVPNSAVHGPLNAGAYSFLAVYNGDRNYQGSTSAVEPLMLSKVNPTITTTANPSTANFGGRLQDEAHLAGGFEPTGSITFRLYRPGVDPTIGPATYTEIVSAVNGDGTYGTTVGFVVNATGTWHWVATYNGDSNNNPVSSRPLDEPVTIPEAADLGVTKTVDNPTPIFGTQVTYTITVTNHGPDTATNVVVADPLPPGLVLIATAPSQGTVGGAVVWSVGTMANGDTAVLHLTAQTAAIGPIVNNAVVDADQFDPDLTNNQDAAGVIVQRDPGQISKQAFLASTILGDPVDPAMFPLNAQFVAQVYKDLLHRQADPSGLAAWSDFLDNGGSRTQLVLGFESSPEYLGDQVDAVYSQLLHRSADPAGRNAFVNFLERGGTVEQMQALIAGSPEYFQKRAGGTNDGFLDALYRDGLGRPVDAGGRATWDQALANGLSRTQVAASIFSSAEYKNDLVNNYYTAYLRRQADPAGLRGWVGQLLGGIRDEQVIADILASDEYFTQVA
jgi:uncharacterized repeat protein (TIGR01451 family)